MRMGNGRRLWMGVVLSAGVLLGSLAWGQDNEAALDKGEVVVTTQEVAGTDIPKVTAKGVINAPMEKVWALIKDCDKYEKTMMNLKSAEELKREGGKIICKTVLDLPFPLDDLMAVTEAAHIERPGKSYTRVWTLREGDFEFNNGSWELTPFKGDPNRTLVVYKVHVQPRTAVPDFLKAKAQQDALPNLFEHLRSQVK